MRLSRPVANHWRSAPATPATAGLSFLAAGAGVAVWRVAERVPRGWWPAGFLALVGGVAQLLV